MLKKRKKIKKKKIDRETDDKKSSVTEYNSNKCLEAPYTTGQSFYPQIGHSYNSVCEK